jgi:LuxR family maltose regulon positive regulatory protein
VSRAAQVEALLVEGYQFAQQRSPGKARVSMDSALRAARPERLRSPFRDVGPAVKQWLSTDAHFTRAGTWLDRESVERLQEPAVPGASIAVESLTAKELEVLELLAELLTTDEIAAKMFVSVNTVKTHVRSVLRKLGVGRRNAAIRRARELGILEK